MEIKSKKTAHKLLGDTYLICEHGILVGSVTKISEGWVFFDVGARKHRFEERTLPELALLLNICLDPQQEQTPFFYAQSIVTDETPENNLCKKIKVDFESRKAIVLGENHFVAVSPTSEGFYLEFNSPKSTLGFAISQGAKTALQQLLTNV